MAKHRTPSHKSAHSRLELEMAKHRNAWKLRNRNPSAVGVVLNTLKLAAIDGSKVENWLDEQDSIKARDKLEDEDSVEERDELAAKNEFQGRDAVEKQDN
jgi:hypothetical protein